MVSGLFLSWLYFFLFHGWYWYDCSSLMPK